MRNRTTLKFVASMAFGTMLILPGSAQAGSLASACDAIAGNLVDNCGFETGDFTDWTATPAASGTHFGVNSIDVHTGVDAAFFMALNVFPDSISQSIATLPGGTYTVTFWLANDENSDIFNAMFGTTNLLSLFDAPPFAYTEFSQNVTVTSGSTLLLFSGSAPVDTLFLDDVSVVPAAVPEPASLGLLAGALLAFGVVRRRIQVT